MSIHHDNHVVFAFVLAMIPLGCARNTSSMSSEDAGVAGPAVSTPEKQLPMLVGWEGPFSLAVPSDPARPFLRDTTTECIRHKNIDIACPSRFLKKHVVPRPGVRLDPNVNIDEVERITICCPDPSTWLMGLTAPRASVDGGAPEPCAHSGIPECDALAALIEDPRYRRREGGASPKVILTCDMWNEAIALHGQEKVRTACLASSELTKLWLRLPKASSSSPAQVPGMSQLPYGGVRPSTLTSPKTPPIVVPGDPDPPEVQ